MYLIIARFFRFLAPIVRTAVVQVAADTLTRAAYPDRPFQPGRGYTKYTHDHEPITRRQSIINVGKAVREANDIPFHDVLMVAFDLRGPNAKNVQEWLADNLPEPGSHGELDEINLDSWWVANDERFDRSDCDSAVLVTKGKQAEARALLRKHGLVD